MTGTKASHIFLDANTALHYKRPDLVDWCALTECKEVVLVSAPIFPREIEKQKIHNPSGKLRKRADSYIRWLVAFVRDRSLEVRPGVRWHFIPAEPPIDFAANNLSVAIADDQLIASVMAYGSPEDADVVVATADIGLEIKLTHHGIKPLLLPEDTKLPDEPDALEKEVLELRRKAAQKHLPNLLLITPTKNNRHPVELRPQVVTASAIPPEEMARKHPVLEQPENLTPEKRASLSPGTLYEIMCAEMSGTLLTPERVDAYNREREAFLTSYSEFYSQLLQWEEQGALTVELDLTLSNEGTAPATDIDIFFYFPEEVILFEAGDFPKRPKEPKPPHRPNCSVFPDMRQFLSNGLDYSHLLHTPHLGPFDPKLHGGATINAEERRIHYWARNLKHGFIRELEKFYFRFPDRQSVRQFHAEYEISSAELPEPIAGKIHFVMDTSNG